MDKFTSRDPEILKSSCGYIANFIDGNTHIGIDNLLTTEQRLELPQVDGNADKLLKYTMLSIWYSKDRKVPFVAAYNIDGNLKKESVKRVEFQTDPRVSNSEQLNKAFYDLIYNEEQTEFEIGHMASHNEMSWGINRNVQAEQTFHFTNSVPQVEKLNSGLWSKLESYVIKETNETQNKRISVFTGPMLADDDPSYIKDRSFKIPLFFYKIVVFCSEGKLYCTAFVMSQLKRLEELKLIDSELPGIIKGFLPPKPFSDYNHKEVFQVNIELIENYTGMKFQWENVSRIEIPNDERKLYKIAQTGGNNAEKKMQEPFRSETNPILTNIILPNR